MPQTATHQELLNLVNRLQQETETLCVRGVRAASEEQVTWMRNAHSQLSGLGASFLGTKIELLIQDMDHGRPTAPSRLLDLLASVRIFERVLTLREAKSRLKYFIQSQEDLAS